METIKSSYPVFREAKVIDTSDPEELGRVKLKVYPELAYIPDEDCPWCFPNDGGIQGKSFGLPLVDSVINCIVWNRYLSEITFLPFTITKPTEHLFDDWIEKQKPKINDMNSDPEEEHFIVDQFEDNFCLFHDTKNKQHGILHPSGTYILINEEGAVYIQSKDNINFKVEKDCKLGIIGNTSISVDGDVNIDSRGKLMIKSSGQCQVESTAITTVKGSSVIIDSSVLEFKGSKTIGTIPPSGTGFACAVAVCPMTGLPHVG